MNDKFQTIIDRLSPKLRGIAHRLNGHLSFFDDDDLFQEELTHLWLVFREGKLDDKTDSYILQGCYFHLKNYLRVTLDKANITSLDEFLEKEGTTLERFLAVEDIDPLASADEALLVEAAKAKGLTKREYRVLTLSLNGMTVRDMGKALGISHVMVVKLRRGIKARCADLKNICDNSC